MGGGSLAALLWLIVCVALVLGLAYWCTRVMAGSGRFGPVGASRDLEIRSQIALGRDQRLVLVRVGGRWLLLGVTASNVSLLAEFTAEEAAQWQEELPESKDTPSFREAFLNILQQKRGRR